MKRALRLRWAPEAASDKIAGTQRFDTGALIHLSGGNVWGRMRGFHSGGEASGPQLSQGTTMFDKNMTIKGFDT